ncbi:MAG: NUDIX hydrolase [Anaerolineaceae bacterium]|nr:NUDIX hydrolase [Anaerolineaceae bacterium]
MNDRPWMHRVAAALRRMPWLVTLAYFMWRWRQAKFSAGVVGVIFDDEGRLLLVNHVFHPHNPWGLPGGWVGRSETPDITLARELMEELEMQIDVGPLVAMELTGSSHMDYAYLCTPKNRIGAVSRELLGYKWQDIAELPSLYDFHYRAVQQALGTRQTVME